MTAAFVRKQQPRACAATLSRLPTTQFVVQTLTINRMRILTACASISTYRCARIVQHGASMAAYNPTMTLLHATQLEWTDFAKPVIFHEGLIVLVQLFRVLRFCLLTNDPQ
jgi:hypothetical protein